MTDLIHSGDDLPGGAQCLDVMSGEVAQTDGATEAFFLKLLHDFPRLCKGVGGKPLPERLSMKLFRSQRECREGEMMERVSVRRRRDAECGNVTREGERFSLTSGPWIRTTTRRIVSGI